MAQIKRFLQDTKGLKRVNIENFFPDLRCFISSAWPQTKSLVAFGDESLTVQTQICHLGKLILKVKAQLADGGDDA